MKLLSHSARINEVSDLSHRLVELYNSNVDLQNDSFLKNIFTEMDSQAKSVTEAIKRDRIFSSLEDADAKRDKAIRTLGKVIEGYKANPLESIKPHGEKLAAVFDKYGLKIIKQSYSEESSLIESLLLDLSAGELQTNISALLGVKECIENLRKEQDEFAKIRADYDVTSAQKQAQQSATSLRKPLLDLINQKLIPYLITMKMVDSAKYESFTTATQQVIDSANATIKARKKKPTEEKK